MKVDIKKEFKAFRHEVATRALKEAVAIIGDCLDLKKAEHDEPTCVQKVIEAFKAIHTIQLEARRTWHEKYPEKYYPILGDVTILGSACHAAAHGLGADDVIPDSVGALPFLVFYQALHLVELSDELRSRAMELTTDGEMFLSGDADSCNVALSILKESAEDV